MKTRACVLYAQEDLRIEERDVGEVGPQQVLVRIGAGGVCGSDIHYYWDGGIGTILTVLPVLASNSFNWLCRKASPLPESPDTIASSAAIVTDALKTAPAKRPARRAE